MPNNNNISASQAAAPVTKKPRPGDLALAAIKRSEETSAKVLGTVLAIIAVQNDYVRRQRRNHTMSR
jgi:hypothetical protein